MGLSRDGPAAHELVPELVNGCVGVARVVFFFSLFVPRVELATD